MNSEENEHPISGISPVSSPERLQRLLDRPVPDWLLLARSAEEAREQQPLGTVAWAEKRILRSKRALVKGRNYDIWQIPDGLCLYPHPGLIQRLLGWLFNLLAKMFQPYYLIKRKLESLVRQLALRLGVFFGILGLPLALLGFLGDTTYLIVAFLRSIPSLLLSPTRLLTTLAALPFQLLTIFLARLFWALLLPWIARPLESMVTAQDDLRRTLGRFPWLRGVLLGFLRLNRPAYPALIHKDSVSQVLIAKRRGLLRTNTFLVIVEGEPLKPGIRAWIASLIKHIVLPFYWERSVHMIGIPRADQDGLLEHISSALDSPAVEWR